MEAGATPPDGGWGWMVVLGAALINMVNQAMFAVYGLIFGEELKAMAGGKATGITLVMSVSVMVTNFSGLLVGPLMRRFSVTSITVVGVLCVGSGMIMSSFSTQIWQIVIGYGCFTGLGLGLLASVTFLAINSYFTKKKSTAVGLSMAGTSVGQMLMPTFIGMLLKKYEFSGTTLILGIMSYSGILGALLFNPICLCRRDEQKDERIIVENGANSDLDVNFNDDSKQSKDEEHGKDPSEGKILLKDSKVAKWDTGGIISNGIKANYKESAVEITNSAEFARTVENTETRSCFGKMIESMGLYLLAEFSFVHILLGLSLAYVSSITFSTFFPMFLQDEVRLPIMETTYCMTALSFADIVGRTTISEICRRFNLGNRSTFMMGCILLAICRSCMVELTGFKSIFALSLLIGYSRAATVINQNLVISEYIDKEKLPPAIGLNMVFKGLFIISLGQLLGLMKDLFNYRICIHILDVILFLVVISWSIELLIKRRRSRA